MSMPSAAYWSYLTIYYYRMQCVVFSDTERPRKLHWQRCLLLYQNGGQASTMFSSLAFMVSSKTKRCLKWLIVLAVLGNETVFRCSLYSWNEINYCYQSIWLQLPCKYFPNIATSWITVNTAPMHIQPWLHCLWFLIRYPNQRTARYQIIIPEHLSPSAAVRQHRCYPAGGARNWPVDSWTRLRV